MCDVKLCSSELKSLRGTQPHPCGFRNSAVAGTEAENKTAQTPRETWTDGGDEKYPQTWLKLDSQMSPPRCMLFLGVTHMLMPVYASDIYNSNYFLVMKDS